MSMPRRSEDVTVDGRFIRPPIHRLPPEILSEIFVLLPPSCTEWYDVFDVSRPPWSLGHICSSWRSTVVSSCRSIWSNPWIPFSNANGDMELHGPISLLQTALERSGNHELSFSFSYDVEDNGVVLSYPLNHRLYGHVLTQSVTVFHPSPTSLSSVTTAQQQSEPSRTHPDYAMSTYAGFLLIPTYSYAWLYPKSSLTLTTVD
ncbi:hypothetical protein F5146DRAFT_1141059 [Armillaria mellea]|nr:hypothetical protein F5146DRAFT_1141059 [Armillaria mellea]